MSLLPRPQEIVLPILREALPDVHVNTWIADVDYREFPLIIVRRFGGVRDQSHPTLFSKPIIELSAYSDEGLPECEQLYEDALEALYLAVQNQTMTDAGYLQSVRETMGASQFSSLFQDSWRIQGLIMLGIRPPRTTT